MSLVGRARWGPAWAFGASLVPVLVLGAFTTAPSACDQLPDQPPDAAPQSAPDICAAADAPAWCEAGAPDADLGCAFSRADGICLARGPFAETCDCPDCADAGFCTGGCLDDGLCGAGPDGGSEDCTCNGCAQASLCAPKTVGCVDDGVCRPDQDDCVCADCAEEPNCRACVADGFCAAHVEACVCHDCLTEPRCVVDPDAGDAG